MRTLTAKALVVAALAAVGCTGEHVEFTSEARKANGMVIILPGIEGESPMNHDIRRGLVAAGIHRALPIYPWGRPVPIAGPLLNQMDVLGNRLAGGRIAKMIEQYQDTYPGRPVHLIGHSGGGGVAVFAAEALSPGRKVDGLVLLSASISSTYDLSKALRHVKSGIVNFYSGADVGLLVIGTTIAGNVDGVRGPAAGSAGFQKRKPGLYQIDFSHTIGGADAHSAATRASFVSGRVAPWIRSPAWPAGGARRYALVGPGAGAVAKDLARAGR
jgi:pimeloyl-ACP methyl ester carboxylesterase